MTGPSCQNCLREPATRIFTVRNPGGERHEGYCCRRCELEIEQHMKHCSRTFCYTFKPIDDSLFESVCGALRAAADAGAGR